jgi:hypothetical protein
MDGALDAVGSIWPWFGNSGPALFLPCANPSFSEQKQKQPCLQLDLHNFGDLKTSKPFKVEKHMHNLQDF